MKAYNSYQNIKIKANKDKIVKVKRLELAPGLPDSKQTFFSSWPFNISYLKQSLTLTSEQRLLFGIQLRPSWVIPYPSSHSLQMNYY